MNTLTILSDHDIQAIHETSLSILRDVGVHVPHPEILRALHSAGAEIDQNSERARLPERLVMDCLDRAGKRYVLYGRDCSKSARYGYGDLIFPSTAGQFARIEEAGGRRRNATIQDLHDAIVVGDALEHIDVVGGMGLPEEMPTAIQDIYMAAELVKGTLKPTHVFVANASTLSFILEIYHTVSGGRDAHRKFPMLAVFIEPVSPSTDKGLIIEVLIDDDVQHTQGQSGICPRSDLHPNTGL